MRDTRAYVYHARIDRQLLVEPGIARADAEVIRGETPRPSKLENNVRRTQFAINFTTPLGRFNRFFSLVQRGGKHVSKQRVSGANESCV